jgi:hypothetical protein
MHITQQKVFLMQQLLKIKMLKMLLQLLLMLIMVQLPTLVLPEESETQLLPLP